MQNNVVDLFSRKPHIPTTTQWELEALSAFLNQPLVASKLKGISTEERVGLNQVGYYIRQYRSEMDIITKTFDGGVSYGYFYRVMNGRDVDYIAIGEMHFAKRNTSVMVLDQLLHPVMYLSMRPLRGEKDYQRTPNATAIDKRVSVSLIEDIADEFTPQPHSIGRHNLQRVIETFVRNAETTMGGVVIEMNVNKYILAHYFTMDVLKTTWVVEATLVIPRNKGRIHEQ